MPPDVITQFIVRQSDDIIDEADVWRYGAILNDPDEPADRQKFTALVYQEYDYQTITVKVKGTDRKEYFQKLQKILDEIFDGYEIYKTDNLSRRYRLIESSGKLGEDWVEGKDLIAHDASKIQYPSPTDGELKNPGLTVDSYGLDGNSFNFGNVSKLEIHIHNHKETCMDKKAESKLEVYGNNNQVNTAHDHSTINATQNNSLDMEEFQRLVDSFINALPENISKEVKEEIEGNISIIKEEIQAKSPNKFSLKNAINAIKVIAGTIGLAANFSQIADYVQRFIP
jgi:hypothetical protein